MPASQSRLRIVDVNGVTRVEFLDRNILDEANIQQIGEEIGRVVDGQVQPKLLISFGNVDHLSSAALGTLITLRHKVDAKDGQLRLSDIKPQIHTVFEITKLTRLFHIHETAADALKSFA
ncbi:MAG TPA: STAS domain-containing protein [Phycisphaerales bacterium]|nr:STAS domain-containing protein [Phycisphaerales bacterium]HMP36080.1 STAS domain-containing protein [Phycisphaerales bacterium]